MNNSQDAFEFRDRVVLMEDFTAKVRPPWGGDWYPIVVPRLTRGRIANNDASFVQGKWYFPVLIDEDRLEMIVQGEPPGSYTPPSFWLPAEYLSKPEKSLYWRWPHWTWVE